MGRQLLLTIIMTTVVLFFMLEPQHVNAECTGSVSDCTGSHTKVSSTSQSKVTVKSNSGVSSNGTFASYIKLLFALIFVLFLIYVLYRFVSKKTKSFQDYGAIKNIGGVAVGPNRSVQLVRVGKDILIVGVGENVQLLKEINDQEVINDFLQQTNTDINPLKPIWEQWGQRIKELTSRKISTNASFKIMLANKLQSMSDDRKKTYESIKKQEDHDE